MTATLAKAAATDPFVARSPSAFDVRDSRAPRYTSYPTALQFSDAVDGDVYGEWLAALNPAERVSLYVHVPFCARLCWYCGCHTRVVNKASLISDYVENLIDELALVEARLPGHLTAGALHLGGGTPNMLSRDDLVRLFGALRHVFRFAPGIEISAELDPATLTESWVRAAAFHGLTRASLGVQDLAPHVQEAVNRVEPFETVARAVGWLRAAGVGSINLDLMYGLPRQTTADVRSTLDAVLTLRPERIALFGYAHVPWAKPHQRLLPEDELLKLVTLKPGSLFSREQVTATTKAISERLGNDGYAFANVNAAPELDKEKKQVAFTLFVDPGRRVYVRRIQVLGNTRSRDEVIRREMRQMEAAWYDGEKINKSRTRVDRLGYFDEVTVETPAVPGTTDQVDLNVNVKEKPTGNLMLGAGLSSSEGLVFSGSIQQQNLFGSGKHVGVGFNTSKINKLYSFSYTDPYYTVDGISRGFDLYMKDTDTSKLTTLAAYATKSLGAGVRYGIPIGEDDNINFGLAFDSTQIKETTNTPQRFKDFIAQYGTNFSGVIGTLGWAKNTLDSHIYPMKGYVAQINGELGLGSTLKYYRTNLKYQRYFPFGRDYTLMLNGEFGLADGLGGKPLPFYKYYYSGGVGSVRGYKAGSLSQFDTGTEERFGGDRRLVANAEFLFPMPGGGMDKSFRLGAFVDAGWVWGVGEKLNVGDMRYSAGLSLAWTSPLGPLKFSLAQPLNKKDGDQTQRLQFQMGTLF